MKPKRFQLRWAVIPLFCLALSSFFLCCFSITVCLRDKPNAEEKGVNYSKIFQSALMDYLNVQ